MLSSPEVTARFPQGFPEDAPRSHQSCLKLPEVALKIPREFSCSPEKDHFTLNNRLFCKLKTTTTTIIGPRTALPSRLAQPKITKRCFIFLST
jgi:hypothetical protein